MWTRSRPAGFALAGLAVGALLLLVEPPAPAAAQTAASAYFSDVEGATHADAIDAIREAGIAEGCDEDRYCPDRSVTRAQMASFLVRALELPAAEGEHFVDVDERDEHADSIDALHEAGITEGCATDRYCPDRSVTRAQMASMLARGFDLPDSDESYFTDVPEVHRAGIDAVADAGVTAGCRPLGLAYCPYQDVPRDEMATFLARASGLVERVTIPLLLAPGDRGEHVTTLQGLLDGLGYHLDGEDGVYGTLTEHAVRAFQRVQDITVDGIYGPETRGELMAAPRTVMSSFTTPLVPGQARNTNIHLGADYVHGDVVEPGETYSINAGIGRRTLERGFVEDGFIDEGGDITNVIGGGVSQLATTMVNAVWFSGIELDDFRQHTIYFERYPMCREGTLVWDVLDVVFTNDTPHPIAISSSYSSSGVTFTFVADPWAEVASWTGEPYDVAGPGGAFSVSCGRTITDPDGRSDSEEYSWRYDEGYPG